MLFQCSLPASLHLVCGARAALLPAGWGETVRGSEPTNPLLPAPATELGENTFLSCIGQFVVTVPEIDIYSE